MQYILILLLCFSWSQDFWKEKPKVYERIKDGEIIVSAKLNKQDHKKYLKLVSAGHIKSSLDFTWQEILAFENYNKISDHFRNIKHDHVNHKVYLEMGALGYYAKLWIDYKIKRQNKKNILSWQVVKGGFKGLKGDLIVSEYKPNISEISIKGDLLAKKIPIPNVLLKVGLEFVGKIMAKKMRKYIEKRYQTADIF